MLLFVVVFESDEFFSLKKAYIPFIHIKFGMQFLGIYDLWKFMFKIPC